jgi:hypothetical protein
VVEAVDGRPRGEAPAVGVAQGRRLDARLQRVRDAAADTIRRQLGTVSLAALASGGGR